MKDGCGARSSERSTSNLSAGASLPGADDRDGRFSRGIAGALVVVLALSAPSSAALAADRASAQGAEAAQTQVQASFPASTAVFDKTEVVYVSLDATGAARSASVVNMFDVESGGQIVDFGPYDDVLSLSEDKALSREGQATSFSVGEGTFLYQGDISQPVIPWNISLSYELDGRSVSADEVAGVEGEVTIHLKTGRNEDADRAFYDSYMLQATFTLPAGTCSDVVAEQATLAMSGEDRTVAFTVLPGHDGDFTIKMNAKISRFLRSDRRASLHLGDRGAFRRRNGRRCLRTRRCRLPACERGLAARCGFFRVRLGR